MSSPALPGPPPATVHDATTAEPAPAARLRGDIGVVPLVFTVLSYNAPLGVLAGVAPLVIGFGVGLGAPLLFLGLGLLMALFAVGYSAMSRHLPNPGAFYSYVTAGLGRPLGLGASFVALTSYTLAMCGALIFTGLAMESLVHGTFPGPDLPWWVWALLLAAAVGFLGYRRVDLSAKVLGVLLGLEIAIVLVWDLVVTVRGGATGELGARSFDPQVLGEGSVVIGLVFAISCFGGFEATAVFRDEVRHPERTIPRATYAAIGLVTAFYTVASWVLVQALGQEQAVGTIAQDPTGAFLGTVRTYLGAVGHDITTVLLVTSAFAALVAYHNVVSRYLFSLGTDGVLPAALGRPHAAHGSPHRASALLSGITITFVVVAALVPAGGPVVYAQLIGISGYAFIVLLVLAAVGIAAYLVRRQPAGLSVWHWGIAPTASAVLLGLVGVLSTENLDLLTGSPALSAVALAVAFGTVLAGAALAGGLRARRPDVFARIGRSTD